MSSITVNVAEDVIPSILACLPVKSLLRFRCVSKPWLAEIDSPDFIKRHLAHSVATPSNYFPVCESVNDTLNSIDKDSLENLQIIETTFNNIPEGIVKLFNSCNGLLLVGVRGLILFNPSTRKHIVLPTSPTGKYDELVPECHSSPCLGYDVVNDDYKVFVFRALSNKATDTFISCEAKIYSLKSNSWKIVEDFTKKMPCFCNFQAYVNGILYSFLDEDNSNIVALDVEKEEFSLIPMPNFEDKNVSEFVARAFNGCLSVSCRYPNYRTDIWVMKEYEGKESWSMLLSVTPHTSQDCVTPMFYSKSGTEVLLCYYHQRLVWYDLRRKTIRACEDRLASDRYRTALPIGFCEVYAESLVSFGGKGKIDEKKKQHGEEKGR